jgi:hypothetical protein
VKLNRKPMVTTMVLWLTLPLTTRETLQANLVRNVLAPGDQKENRLRASLAARDAPGELKERQKAHPVKRLSKTLDYVMFFTSISFWT